MKKDDNLIVLICLYFLIENILSQRFYLRIKKLSKCANMHVQMCKFVTLPVFYLLNFILNPYFILKRMPQRRKCDVDFKNSAFTKFKETLKLYYE